MNADERFELLWNDYLEGDLDDPGMQELRTLLSSNEGYLREAVSLYRTHRMLGLAARNSQQQQDRFVEETLARLPKDRDTFIGGVMKAVQGKREKVARRSSPLAGSRLGWLVSALSLGLGVFYWGGTAFENRAPGVATHPAPVDQTLSNAKFLSLARAEFFGELAPPTGAALATGRDYTLVSGLTKIGFPSGATVIVEGPAVFRVLSDTTLGLDLGECSVHAPPGAEGFRIETPFTRVVDRGTRFSVSVDELSETEIHVVEGAADIYEQSGAAESAQNAVGSNVAASNTGAEIGAGLRLTERQAKRFTQEEGFAVKSTAFDRSRYRFRLPDRVVAYDVKTDEAGDATHLRGVTVQRGGREAHYSTDELIPATLAWFQSNATADRHGHVVVADEMTSPRAAALTRWTLNEGIINPGGSRLPLSTDPVMNRPEVPGQPNTPGFAVTFASPVVNGPGPDVLLMELQTISNPPQGDAFHVSPLSFAGGRKSHTVTNYDLALTSPEAHKLARFQLFRFDVPVHSLEELEREDALGTPSGLNFRALAVGIDLSDLGFAEGETVTGLFFQDAEDDLHVVDPVILCGLPYAGH